MDTFVYIDAFNLYYGCLKKTPYRWLDIRQLCRLMLPTNNVVRIKYFTARVGARQNDPDPALVLTRAATFFKTIRPGALAASQFPNTLTDTNGRFSKPKGW